MLLEARGAHERKWKRYPAYKDSGVEWLGAVPEGWDVKRLKYCATRINEKVDGRESDLPYTGLEHIESWTGRLAPSEEISTSEGQYSRYESGDVLFGKLRPYLAKAFRAKEHGICTGELLVLRPKDVSQDYLFSYVLARDFISIVDSSTYGAKMPRASWDFIGDLPVLLPSEAEQRAIAVFLDRETGRIDALLAKKERQIKLLQEKRAALISHAVTKGLDPDAPMKDSGVEWLGEVPEEWRVKRLKYLASESLKYGANESAELDDPDLPRYIRITDIAEDGLLRVGTFKSLPEDVARPYLLKSGDILFARSGATVGKSFIYHESWGRACYAGYLIRLRVNSRVAAPAFLSYFASSSAYWDWTSSIFIQATIQNISAEKYANLSVAIPPLPEQHAIATFLDRETGCIDVLITKVHESISKLREYRIALISAAVTGKIDVREELVS